MKYEVASNHPKPPKYANLTFLKVRLYIYYSIYILGFKCVFLNSATIFTRIDFFFYIYITAVDQSFLDSQQSGPTLLFS